MKRVQVVMILLVVGLLALAGCAPKATPIPAAPKATALAPEAVSEWDRIVEKAKKEGTLVGYMGLGDDVQTAIMQSFKKTTGITIEILGLEGELIREKVRMEQQVGMYIADVNFSGITLSSDLKGWGFLQPIKVALPEAEKKGFWKIHPYDLDPERERIVLVRGVSPDLLINTNLVKPGEEPKSWNDLLSPKWKGKMVIKDPLSAGSTSLAYPAMKALGEDFWRKLAQQDLISERKPGRQIDMIALGEKPIAIWPSETRAETAIAAGAPVRLLHLQEGSPVVLKGGGIIKNAPHPNAALVFLNWLMSKEGQTTVAKASGRDTIRTDIEPTWIKVKEFMPGAEYKAHPYIAYTSEQMEESQAFYKKIFGKR